MKPTVMRYILIFLTAGLLGYGFQGLVLETFQTPNTVMRPSIEPGQMYVLEKWHYVIENALPPIGEVVVYDTLSDLSGANKAPFVKRVVAGPEDKIEIRKGRLKINGKEATYEPDPSEATDKKPPTRFIETLPNGKKHVVTLLTPYLESNGEIRVPKESVYLVQDVRQAGLSSASPSGVAQHAIRGRVRRFCFPWLGARANSFDLGCPLQGSF